MNCMLKICVAPLSQEFGALELAFSFRKYTGVSSYSKSVCVCV